MTVLDTRINVDDFPPTMHFGQRRSASLPLIPSDGSLGCLYVSSYTKLPEEPLRITIRKLDGSSFEIELKRSATVAELKQAVESVFYHVPKSGPGKISWSHVWTNFCLSYDGQKMVEDTDSIKNYGVRDGEEIHFVRHVTTMYHSPKTKKHFSTRKTSYQPLVLEEWKESDDYDDVENGRQYCVDIDDDEEALFGSLCKPWLKYSRLPQGSYAEKGCGFFESCKHLLLFCGCTNKSIKKSEYRDD